MENPSPEEIAALHQKLNVPRSAGQAQEDFDHFRAMVCAAREHFRIPSGIVTVCIPVGGQERPGCYPLILGDKQEAIACLLTSLSWLIDNEETRQMAVLQLGQFIEDKNEIVTATLTEMHAAADAAAASEFAPWEVEGDLRVSGTESGLPFLVTRGHRGNLCGYVAVPKGHPAHGMTGVVACDAVDVHGGITYASDHAPGEEEDAEGRWWLGFDAAHAGDLIPRLAIHSEGDVYRDAGYMQGECKRLAAQLAAMAVAP
jgi:hypothetical protein